MKDITAWAGSAAGYGAVSDEDGYSPCDGRYAVTLLSPRVTPFQGRNTRDAGGQPAFDRRLAAIHPARVMLDAFERIMATRDPATAEHALRVQALAAALGREVCHDNHFVLSAIHAAAPLHDIGKLALPDHVLHKPGPLTRDEYELVKRHAALGAEILDALEFGGPLADIVRHHHENWDGTGYPDGLRGEAIPLGARILAVVDCYDALTSARPYREPLAHAAALEILAGGRGTMYDPSIVDAFMRMVRVMRAADAVLTRDFVAEHPYRMQAMRVL